MVWIFLGNMEASESPGKTLSKTTDKDARAAAASASPESSGRNGARVSTGNGKNIAFCDDLDGGGLDDSEINGISCLLKMQESKNLERLGSVLDVIDKNENGVFDSGDGASLLADIKAKGRNIGVSVNGDSSNGDEGCPDGNFRELSEIVDDEVAEEDMEDGGEDEFSVGGFVWGKIKSHPWWPGRVYDPLDASEFAKKVKHRDRILVAYFGDGTFAWCNPTQLRPFEENFMEMSKQSSSKNFVNAVEKAVDEISRLLDLKMTCSCVPKDNLIGFGRSLVVNAGIREGLLVPEDGIEKFSTALFEPAKLLNALKGFSQTSSFTNLLEFMVLKSRLEAFYRTKGCSQLPTYHVPQPIPGLEDNSRNLAVDMNSYSGGEEVAVRGPVEEDPKSCETTQSTLQTCQGVPEDRHYHRRKQKSIAEILGARADDGAENRDDSPKEGTKSNKSALSSKRKKGKDRGEIIGGNIDNETKNGMGDTAKDGANSGKPESSSGRKKRKGSDEADGGKENQEGVPSGAGRDSDKPTPSSGRKKRKASDEVGAESKKSGDVSEAGRDSGKWASSSGGKKRKGSDEANVTSGDNSTPKPRRIKDTKLSKSLLEAENKDSSLEVDGSVVEKEKKKYPLSTAKKKKASSCVEDDGGGTEQQTDKGSLSNERKRKTTTFRDENDDGEAKEQTDNGSSSRERKKSKASSGVENDGGEAEELTDKSRGRKKSKYLSPPYTNVNKGRRKKEVEAASENISSEAGLGNWMTIAASGKLVGSPPILKCSGEKFQEKISKETGTLHEKFKDSDPPTKKQDKNAGIDPGQVMLSANEVLSQIRSAALSPQYLKESKSLDMVEGFLSAYRSSIYCGGSYYKKYREDQSARKKKSQDSEVGSSGKEQKQNEHGFPTKNPWQTKPRKRKEAKSEEPTVKQDASASDAKSKSRQTKGKRSEEAKSEKPKAEQTTSALDEQSNNRESDRKASAAALVVTFSPGSSLPSKNDLLKIYGKFGALNKGETAMFYHNHCARIVFSRSSEAEEAFNDSQLASPFGKASVTFRLHYLSDETKTRELRELPSSILSPLAKDAAQTLDKTSASQSAATDLSQLSYIKQKLEMMTSMLESSDGKMTQGVKSKLQGEMKDLLEKVNAMVGS